MHTRNVTLTEEQDRFVVSSIESGRFADESEVFRAALKTLEREQRVFDQKVEAFRAAIAEGDASGVAEGDVFARVREKLRINHTQG